MVPPWAAGYARIAETAFKNGNIAHKAVVVFSTNDEASNGHGHIAVLVNLLLSLKGLFADLPILCEITRLHLFGCKREA